MGFDLDGTLTKPFSTSLMWSCVPDVLRRYKVVVTNQYGVTKGLLDIESFKLKLTELRQLIDHSVDFWIATDKDNYRKPIIDIWDLVGI